MRDALPSKQKCCVEGCKRHAETDGYRCVNHSIAYYGGNLAIGGIGDGKSRKERHTGQND